MDSNYQLTKKAERSMGLACKRATSLLNSSDFGLLLLREPVNEDGIPQSVFMHLGNDVALV